MKNAQLIDKNADNTMCVTFLQLSIYYNYQKQRIFYQGKQQINTIASNVIKFSYSLRFMRILIIIIMIKNSNWVESSINSVKKKVHSKPIISISPFDEKLFFTSSEDNTLRLWDIRLHSSVKLFKNEIFTNLTNCDNDKKSQLFVGSGEFVYAFDMRKQNIFIEEINKRNEEAHFDELSVIKVEPTQGILAAGDDEGDARLYNYDLECIELLDQGHLNIINSIDFVKTEKEHLCLTGGFDSKLIHWNVNGGKTVREIDIQDLLGKHQIKLNTPPFIYCVHAHKSTIYVSTQSGHVIAFATKQPKKAKYILQASLSKVIQVRVPNFNENLMLTLSYFDGSFSLFDHTKRVSGCPQFLQKYKCLQHPNWMQTMGRQILISYNSTSELSFFLVK